jgi:hypothetical protein
MLSPILISPLLTTRQLTPPRHSPDRALRKPEYAFSICWHGDVCSRTSTTTLPIAICDPLPLGSLIPLDNTLARLTVQSRSTSPTNVSASLQSSMASIVICRSRNLLPLQSPASPKSTVIDAASNFYIGARDLSLLAMPKTLPIFRSHCLNNKQNNSKHRQAAL